jgi:hypothetical protein
MLKKVLAAATIAGALAGVSAISAGTAVAADCAAGTVVQAHLHGNLNGTPVDQDICLPPAA